MTLLREVPPWVRAAWKVFVKHQLPPWGTKYLRGPAPCAPSMLKSNPRGYSSEDFGKFSMGVTLRDEKSVRGARLCSVKSLREFVQHGKCSWSANCLREPPPWWATALTTLHGARLCSVNLLHDFVRHEKCSWSSNCLREPPPWVREAWKVFVLHRTPPWTPYMGSSGTESLREALTDCMNHLCVEQQSSRHFTERDFPPWASYMTSSDTKSVREPSIWVRESQKVFVKRTLPPWTSSVPNGTLHDTSRSTTLLHEPPPRVRAAQNSSVNPLTTLGRAWRRSVKPVYEFVHDAKCSGSTEYLRELSLWVRAGPKVFVRHQLPLWATSILNNSPHDTSRSTEHVREPRIWVREAQTPSVNPLCEFVKH